MNKFHFNMTKNNAWLLLTQFTPPDVSNESVQIQIFSAQLSNHKKKMTKNNKKRKLNKIKELF